MSSKKKRKSINQRPWTHIHCIYFLFAIALLLSLFLGMTLYLFVLLDVPDFKSFESYQPKLTTRILDTNHTIVARIFDENRLVIPLHEMPDLLPKAFIAAEDARFYQHKGVDLWSIARALIHNLRAGGRGQGGSTITQQVTRSLLLSRKKLYSRKLKEAVLAYRIDSLLSKDDIITIYLNEIYLGEGAHGVEAASLIYFDKPARDLDLAEIAILAGLPKAPSRYSPFNDLEQAKKRQAYVLNRMAEEGYITPTAARKAYKRKLTWAKERKFPGSDYFIEHVKTYIENKYGKKVLRATGLTVYTTLDSNLQKKAAEAIERGINHSVSLQRPNISKKKIPKTTPQGSLISLEIATGKVRAMVGGRDFSTSQFNRALQAKRQPGSAFKPIVYAAALAKGFTPAMEIIDEPIQLPGASPGKKWEPKNFDGKYNGPTTLRDGLIHSRNIVTIKLLQQTGIDAVAELARNLGISSPLAKNLSLALGSSEVSLLELTAAYIPFANLGRSAVPIFIEKIVDNTGKILEENKPQIKAVLNERVAYQITLMLAGVIEEGTGKKARGLPVAAAGKTGTSDRYRDAWFIGFTPSLVTGVWIGHDQKYSLGRGETGGQIAAPIWLEFMKEATAQTKTKAMFPLPN